MWNAVCERCAPRFAWIAVLAFFATLAPARLHAAQSPSHAEAKSAASSQVCDADDDDDDDDSGDSKPDPFWKRFAFEGACVEISGNLEAVYQEQKTKAGVQSLLTTRRGTVTGASRQTTGTANFRIDTRRKTALGDLKTGFEVKYEKASSDAGNGQATLEEGIVTWGGLKGGYTDSQMNFWDGDFQFSAAAPSRTVGLAGYEFKLSENWTLTLAYETGLPTTRASSQKFVTVYPDDPAASARLYYDADDVSFQLAGLVHELRTGTDASDLLVRFPGFAPDKAFGWAATAGLTAPGKIGAKGSEFSMQATYAVNSSPYLGTAADFSSLASAIPVPVTTKGWSVVGSYHLIWSKHWESNILASYLALDVSLSRAAPSVRTQRYAANLIWRPLEDFRIGAEVGYVDSEIALNGPLGLIQGISGTGTIYYLSATRDF